MKRALVVLVNLGMLALLLAALTAYSATANPRAQVRQFDLQFGRGNIVSVLVLPCSATTPGRVLVGHNIFISSRPPPGISMPTAPSCP
jgi:hypothetical protein